MGQGLLLLTVGRMRVVSHQSKECLLVSRGSLLLKVELPSNPETLCIVRNALGQLAQTLGFPEPDCRSVVLAVDEALTNIIRHAYHGKPEQPIEVSFRRIQAARDGVLRPALEIVLEDRGAAVDAKKLCGRPLDDLRSGGRGLLFMRESMDAVEFRRRWHRNQLRMVKLLHAEHVAEPAKGA
jgi:anti-sigma regulatory factor (Ser/Thr protein kinase)